MTPSQRRQNSSCDPCRRSKRRCFFASPQNGDADVACTHCTRLGHACTFDFVKSRAGSHKQRRRNHSRSHQSREWNRPSISEFPADGYTGLASSESQADMAEDDILASWLDFGGDRWIDENRNCLDALVPSASDAATAVQVSDARFSIPPNHPDRVKYALPSIPGVSLGSPIRLLNSKLDATVLDERLARIHNTIVTGCASRFVEYDCNLHATASRYRFGDGVSASSQEQTPAQLNLLPHGVSPQLLPSGSETHYFSLNSGMALRDTGCMLTVLGTVRFLDHFSDLYGNRLTPAGRRQSDDVLKAVLQAFSLQWLSISEATSSTSENLSMDSPNGSPTLISVFHDAWFRARSLVKDAQSVRSFRIVYAILLFDGIVIPTEAGGASTESAIAHEFLDVGLDKLCSLDTLVKQYSDTLGPQSTYSALLDASLSVVRWAGYIRDIGAALTTDYQCKLPGISSPAKGTLVCPLKLEKLAEQNGDEETYYSHGQILDWSDDQNLHPDLDGRVLNICKEAVAKAFCIWRQIIEVKKHSSHRQMQSGTRDPSEFSKAITSTVTAVGKFNSSFRSFMDSCIKNLSVSLYAPKRLLVCSIVHSLDLIIAHRIHPVSIILFWDLSVLLLAELLQPIKGACCYLSEHLASSMSAYQEEAISFVARTVESILSLPTEELFNIENDLDAEVPIIAYHITPGLTATAFQKTIENIISLHCPREGADLNAPPNLTADSVWQRQIDIVMKGLSSLGVTVGGSQAASAVFQSLMRQHGDILSECWTSDFST